MFSNDVIKIVIRDRIIGFVTYNMAREKKIDKKELVMELAGLNCSQDEIARILKVSVSTIQRNYKAEMTKGKEYVKTSLRRAQYRSALNGSFVMQIWLGKNLLGQTDKIETHSQDEIIFTRSEWEFENDKPEPKKKPHGIIPLDKKGKASNGTRKKSIPRGKVKRKVSK